MKKIPIITILMTFYQRSTMKYVGQNWRGTGYALLLGLVGYGAVFVTFSWNSYLKSTYENYYRPTLSNLPPVTYQADHFIFESEMPVTLKHPLTDDKAIYIDTTQEKIPEEDQEYQIVITKNHLFMNELPSVPFEHKIIHRMMTSILKTNPFESNKFLDANSIIEISDRIINVSHYFTFVMVFLLMLLIEISKTLFITVIVMVMFRKNSLEAEKLLSFKFINRLCILTYIPVLFVNTLYLYNLSSQGIFVLIATSMVHIVLLMKAIHANISPDSEESGDDF